MRLTARIAAVLALAPIAAAAPPGALAQEAPTLRAQSAILVDARTGEVLLARSPDARRSIASTTKLMTALLALERAEPGDVFTAPRYDALPVESQIRLREGERMTVEDLLEALLLESANDAAVAIAAGVAGSRAAFVDEMNRRARELGLRETRYANPIGLDDPDNYSSARDLARLARRLLRDRLFRRIVDQPRAVLETGARRRIVQNRNRLVAREPFVDGVKTGRTRRAGYVLVGSASGRGARVVSVVLGEPTEAARDADTLALLRFGIDQFRRVPALRRGRAVARADVAWHDRRVRLVPERGVAVTVRRGERPRLELAAPVELEGPMDAGEQVGSARVSYRGRVVGTVPLVTGEPVPGAGPLRRVVSALGVPLTSVAVLVMVVTAMLTALRVRARRMRRRARA